jgi:hypothetical protein
MHKIRRGITLQIANYSITPVEQICVNTNAKVHGFFHYVSYEPLGIIIESNKTQWALDIKGKSISIEELLASE